MVLYREHKAFVTNSYTLKQCSHFCAPVSIPKPVTSVCSALCSLGCLHALFYSNCIPVLFQRSAETLTQRSTAGFGVLGGFGLFRLGFLWVYVLLVGCILIWVFYVFRWWWVCLLGLLFVCLFSWTNPHSVMHHCSCGIVSTNLSAGLTMLPEQLSLSCHDTAVISSEDSVNEGLFYKKWPVAITRCPRFC